MGDPLKRFWIDEIEVDRNQPSGTFGESESSVDTHIGWFDVSAGTSAEAAADRDTFAGTVYFPLTVADIPLESTLTCRDVTVTVAEFRRLVGPKGTPGHLEMKVR